MESTVAVQTNGFGFLFHALRKAAIQAFKSCTLPKAPRRIAFALSSPNHRSTRLSQLALVGTKCGTKRGWRLNQARTFSC